MEGFKQNQAPEVEREILERNEKLEKAGETVHNLFEEIGKKATKEVGRNPFYRNFSERDF